MHRTDAAPIKLAPRRGVTLIEMLMVAVLIGMTTVFVAPKIDVMSYRVNSAMQGIGTTLLAAQRLAVTRQHDVIVGFDTKSNTIHVHDDADNSGAVNDGEHVATTPLGESIVYGLAGAPEMTAGDGPITFTKTHDGFLAVTFHRDGSASEAGIVYLTSQRAINMGEFPNDARAIWVERATGQVSWYRYLSPEWKRGF